jgi:hypothetical protein
MSKMSALERPDRRGPGLREVVSGSIYGSSEGMSADLSGSGVLFRLSGTTGTSALTAREEVWPW